MQTSLLFIALLVFGIAAEEMAVTKEFVDYLKKHATYEVADYEDSIFRGWTLEEVKGMLGLRKDKSMKGLLPVQEESDEKLPSELSWAGGSCDHEVRNQGNCGSCWAFAATGMLTDRCCLMSKDQGWLSPQELVSCERRSHGCNGGYMESPVNYMVSNGGLVKEECFPYQAKNLPCPSKCVDGGNWKSSHVCKCSAAKCCYSMSSLKSCLQSGPVSMDFEVVKSFLNYKSGVFKCDNSGTIGGHATLAMGFGDQPECYVLSKNSWSVAWGDKGYFKMGCNTCDLEGGCMCGKVE